LAERRRPGFEIDETKIPARAPSSQTGTPSRLALDLEANGSVLVIEALRVAEQMLITS
jgi:hypothetical protein